MDDQKIVNMIKDEINTLLSNFSFLEKNEHIINEAILNFLNSLQNKRLIQKYSCDVYSDFKKLNWIQKFFIDEYFLEKVLHIHISVQSSVSFKTIEMRITIN